VARRVVCALASACLIFNVSQEIVKPVAIILNGVSSSGKTSIAKAIQRLSKNPVLHVSLDNFTDMFHWPAIDEASRGECHRIGVANYHAVLPILASCRFAIVVDHVFEQHAWFEACCDALKKRQIYSIGVRCPLDVLEQREKARGDRKIGLSRWQFDRVHEKKTYVYEVDTSKLSPEECATAIVRFIGSQSEANQPLEPTTTAVTDRAVARSAPAAIVAHL
jgi:chloramphenicol 3-O phosphotransferase